MTVDYIKTIFINRHSELRSGWRIALYLIILNAIGFGTAYVLSIVGLTGSIAGGAAFTAASIAATWLMTRYINHKPFASVGFWFHPFAVREFLWGCLLGFLMMGSIFLVLFADGLVELRQQELSVLQVSVIVGSSILVFGSGALLEEVVFRGYPFQTMIQGITLLPAMILMAALFGAAHLGNPNVSVVGILNVALAAIWLSFAYVKTKGLWLPLGLHFSWNFSQTTIFSFRTSGVEFEENRLFLSSVAGPDWLTGGSFGPEGGILATTTLILCTWYILKSKRFKPQPGVITLDSLEDVATDHNAVEEERV